MTDSGSTDEFVWRWRLDDKPQNPLNSDPLLELLRIQWEQILKLCVPVHGNERVRIDGFVLMRDLETVHPIFSDDPRWKKN